jgi:hypothetical protein
LILLFKNCWWKLYGWSNNWVTFILTYLCGTRTNIWLRPVEEDLSMTACRWLLGPGYRCSTHPPTWISVFLDFSLHWVWLWIELFVVGLRIFWSCDQRSAICLSSWHLGHSGCQNLYRFRGCSFSCRHHFRFSDRISFGEPSFKIHWNERSAAFNYSNINI